MPNLVAELRYPLNEVFAYRNLTFFENTGLNLLTFNRLYLVYISTTITGRAVSDFVAGVSGKLVSPVYHFSFGKSILDEVCKADILENIFLCYGHI